jgi:ABC-type multidrug transport system ATPase subunit
MQILGLTHRADTIVGNAMMRGVSGGEKKRVTVTFAVYGECISYSHVCVCVCVCVAMQIGVELMKNPRLLLLDEATTGNRVIRFHFGK